MSSEKSIYGRHKTEKRINFHVTIYGLKDVDTLNTRKAVAERIIKLCAERGISINALARLSAVPPSTLKNIINGGSKNAGIVTIKMLCDGLNISLADFFNTEIFRSLEQEIK